jgi:hypothetical protein
LIFSCFCLRLDNTLLLDCDSAALPLQGKGCDKPLNLWSLAPLFACRVSQIALTMEHPCKTHIVWSTKFWHLSQKISRHDKRRINSPVLSCLL